MKHKIVLGTVQFGLQYGINSKKRPSEQEVFSILDYAFSQGVQTLDTADVYGNALSIIGAYHHSQQNRFKIISKFKLQKIDSFNLSTNVINQLRKLSVNQLEGFLFHSYKDYQTSPFLLNQLVDLQRQGLVKQIGVSIYTNQELEQVIQDKRIELIQLPYNLLDNYKFRGKLLEKAKKMGKIIHIRSVFLQGLFFKNINQLPLKLQSLTKPLKDLHLIIKQANLTIPQAALAYPLQNELIDGVLIGIDSLQQLKTNLGQLNLPIPKSLNEQIESIEIQRPQLLNPVNWS